MSHKKTYVPPSLTEYDPKNVPELVKLFREDRLSAHVSPAVSPCGHHNGHVMKPRTSKRRTNKQMVLDETIAELIETIKLLNTSIVAMSDELRHWGQDNRSRAVEEWASHELQSPQSSLADTPEATESLTVTERRAILKALVQTNGNTLKAARVLGIGRTTLYRRLREYRANNHSR